MNINKILISNLNVVNSFTDMCVKINNSKYYYFSIKYSIKTNNKFTDIVDFKYSIFSNISKL